MSFGIISEGITDHVIIKNILYGFFKDTDLEINELHPKDRKKPYGWTKVIEYCKTSEFKDAFDWNDYIVIQIDTDTKQDWGYSDIPNTRKGDKKSIENLINKVVEIFTEIIGMDFYKKHQDRIIFAVAVHSIECWMLPFYAVSPSHVSKIDNCLDTLNSQYLSKKGFTIDPKAKGYDDNRFYEKAAQPLKKNKELLKNGKKNPSLNVFLNKLSILQIQLIKIA